MASVVAKVFIILMAAVFVSGLTLGTRTVRDASPQYGYYDHHHGHGYGLDHDHSGYYGGYYNYYPYGHYGHGHHDHHHHG